MGARRSADSGQLGVEVMLFLPDFMLGYDTMDETRPFPFLCVLHGTFATYCIITCMLGSSQHLFSSTMPYNSQSLSNSCPTHQH